jgi:hypothetical protein
MVASALTIHHSACVVASALTMGMMWLSAHVQILRSPGTEAAEAIARIITENGGWDMRFRIDLCSTSQPLPKLQAVSPLGRVHDDA